MTTFYVIRHGEKERFAGDPPLTAKGRDQAMRTAAYLSQLPVEAIFVSPQRRAMETAGIIAEHVNLPSRSDARLRERMNRGDVEGQSDAEFYALWYRCSADRDFVPPGGTSARETGTRMQAMAEEAAKEYPDGVVVLVSHGGAIGDWLLNQFEVNELRAQFRFDPDALGECSITRIERDRDGTYELKQFANREHLI